jgi:hypothetical protein
MRPSPFDALGITQEMVKGLKREVVVEIVRHQRSALLRCFHPDGVAAHPQKYLNVQDAFDAINPDNPDSRFDDELARLKGKKPTLIAPSTKIENLTFQLEIAWGVTRNAMMGLIPPHASKPDDRGNVLSTRVNTLRLPDDVYLMISVDRNLDLDGCNKLHKSIGVIIRDGTCHLYTEEKIAPDTVEQLREEGHTVIRKGDSRFVLTPINVADHFFPLGSCETFQQDPSIPRKAIGGAVPQEALQKDLHTAIRDGLVFSPEIAVDKSFLVWSIGQNGRTLVTKIGKISRLSLPNDYRLEGIFLKNKEDGLAVVDNCGVCESACTISRFAKDYNFDKDYLVSAIRHFGIDVLPLTLEEDDLYRLETLLRLRQRLCANDYFVYYQFGASSRRACSSEVFLNWCKKRTPPMYDTEYYSRLASRGIRSVCKAFCGQTDVAKNLLGGGKSRNEVEVFDVEELEELYESFSNELPRS